MTKLEIQAIKLLPEDYCVDGLIMMTHKGYVFAFAPIGRPIQFDPKSKQWTPILFRKLKRA